MIGNSENCGKGTRKTGSVVKSVGLVRFLKEITSLALSGHEVQGSNITASLSPFQQVKGLLPLDFLNIPSDILNISSDFFNIPLEGHCFCWAAGTPATLDYQHPSCWPLPWFVPVPSGECWFSRSHYQQSNHWACTL